MKKFYFTFGCGQLYANCYTVIEAKDSEAARKEMFRLWGERWSMQYNSAGDAGVDEFKLREIAIQIIDVRTGEPYD